MANCRSININVIPSFGHIVNVAEPEKDKLVVVLLTQVHEVERWRQAKGVLHVQPKGFDPTRYASFSVR